MHQELYAGVVSNEHASILCEYKNDEDREYEL